MTLAIPYFIGSLSLLSVSLWMIVDELRDWPY